MARSNVPKFGNWDTEENVPYTTYFENARRAPSSEKVNGIGSPGKPNSTSNQEAQRRSKGARTRHERVLCREEGEFRRPIDSPSHQRHGGFSSDSPKRGASARPNGGGFHNAGHSPLHTHYQAKIGGKGTSGVSSPSRERKGSRESSHGLAPSTPGRSRLRSRPRGNETPERVAAIPKFGEWDATDPSSADGFSHIFNKVKEERHGGLGNVSGATKDSQRSNGQKRYRSKHSKGCCCFPWARN